MHPVPNLFQFLLLDSSGLLRLPQRMKLGESRVSDVEAKVLLVLLGFIRGEGLAAIRSIKAYLILDLLRKKTVAQTFTRLHARRLAKTSALSRSSFALF